MLKKHIEDKNLVGISDNILNDNQNIEKHINTIIEYKDNINKIKIDDEYEKKLKDILED